MRRIAFSSHVTLIEGKEYDGIGNTMLETLSTLNDEFIFVRHSMDGLLRSEVRYYTNVDIVRVQPLRVLSRVAPLRYISELLKTIYYFSTKERVEVYIGIDPLNAVAGVVLKKLHRVKKAIFYTADYSPRRFKSGVMSKIYHLIDLYCVKNADEVWSVSSRIVDIRKHMGLPDYKNIFLPNAPPVEYNYYRNHRHDKYALITYGIIDKQLDFEGAIRAVAMLQNEYDKLRLIIVGNGPEERRLKKLAKDLGVADRIDFMGRQPLAKTLDIASRAGIGLALYTGAWGFNKYGDSTKCREYFNYGLPVISTDTHSTVKEIKEYKAGEVVGLSIEEYVMAIRTIINNYNNYSQRSLELGKKYEGAHKAQLLRIMND